MEHSRHGLAKSAPILGDSMRKALLTLVLSAIVFAGSSLSTAQADGNIVVHRTQTFRSAPVGYLANRWVWRPYSLNRTLGYMPAPPYFAQTPPVYIKENVVSYSPFFHQLTNKKVAEPQVVMKPYVEQAAAEGNDSSEVNADMEAAAMDMEMEATEVVADDMPQVVDAAGSAVADEVQPEVVENDTL